MTRFKFLLIIALLISIDVSAQNSCDINATTEVVNTPLGKNSGSIKIKIVDDSQDIKVFLLNQGEDQAKKEVNSRKLDKLKSGKYEFIIIHTKSDKCYKYLTVEIREISNE